MADIAASVLTRLKNKAQASGRSDQLSLQLFCQEEFLRRLEKSKYAENFVLKGGLFIYSLTEFDSRVTVDVDFLLRQMPNTPEQLRVVLEEIIAAPTENEFVTFEIIENKTDIDIVKNKPEVNIKVQAKGNLTSIMCEYDISKNDGMFNNSYNHKRDTIINMNTFVQLSRRNYSPEQIQAIKAAQMRYQA